MFKKILCISCIFLLMLGSVQIFAAGVESSTVLIKENGVLVNVTAKAVPDKKVAIMFLKPDSGEINHEKLDDISYLGQVTADENGEVSEVFYIPEGTGEHTLKMSNCRDVSYEVLRLNYEFFAASWSNDYIDSKYIFPFYKIKISDCCDSVTEGDITTRTINEEKIKASAQAAKEYFENVESGKRYMIIWQELIRIIDDNPQNYLWWDSGVAELKSYMDCFFKQYRAIDGKVDGVVCDFEPTPMDASNLKKEADALDDPWSLYKTIENDARYETEIKSELVKRDFNFSSSEYTELYGIYASTWSINALKWNSVISNKRAAYLDQAAFNVVREYYPEAKCSAYGYSERGNAHMMSTNSHKVYRAGKSSHAGTHSSFSLYGTIQSEADPQYMQEANLDDNGHYLRNPFTMLKYDVNRARQASLTDENGFMPWIANPDYNSATYSFGQTPYYYELIFHVGLLNPDPFLFWGPKYGSETTEYVQEQAEKLDACLEELDILAGYPDKESLVTSLESWNTDFILSGMSADGRNIYRITPNLEITDDSGNAYTIESFCTNEETPTFKISGTEITFPQGKIVEYPRSIASYGYWVEMPDGASPVITYDEQYYDITDDGFFSEIHVFDNETGMQKDYLTDGVTVRVSYKNRSGNMQSAVVFAAGYTAEDEQMVFVHKIFEGSIAFGEDGYKIYKIDEISDEVKKLKLFLWDGGEKLIPLGGAVELGKAN